MSAWNRKCTESCGDADSSAVALFDSGVTHSFIFAALVNKFSLPVKPGGNMEVTLADGSQVKYHRSIVYPWLYALGIARLCIILLTAEFCRS